MGQAESTLFRHRRPKWPDVGEDETVRPEGPLGKRRGLSVGVTTATIPTTAPMAGMHEGYDDAKPPSSSPATPAGRHPAIEAARKRGLTTILILADWRTQGRLAGYNRTPPRVPPSAGGSGG